MDLIEPFSEEKMYFAQTYEVRTPFLDDIC
jgi:hypothetical protein